VALFLTEEKATKNQNNKRRVLNVFVPSAIGIQLPTDWDDQNDDGETKTILNFIGKSLNHLTLQFS
jgi:hypothetical protein